MSLVSELRDHLVLAGAGNDLADFVNIMGQRFLAIHMFAAPHRFHGDDCVVVVRCANNHGIDLVPHLIKHHPVILEPLRVGVPTERLGGVVVVHIAERHDILTFSRRPRRRRFRPGCPPRFRPR